MKINKEVLHVNQTKAGMNRVKEMRFVSTIHEVPKGFLVENHLYNESTRCDHLHHQCDCILYE